MKYTIVTDTSANLPGSIVEQHDIKLVPLSYILEGKESICLNPSTFDGQTYYKALKAKASVKTSLASSHAFLETFERELSLGNDILFVGISSGISGTFQSARNAALELLEKYPQRKIVTIDTLAASLGEGISVLEAIKMREEGASLEEVENRLSDMVKKVNQIFTVEDLGYLHRGGRISGVSALIGSVLHINPILKGDDEGKILLDSKVRGRKKALLTLAEFYKNNVENAADQVVCISHCWCPEDAAELGKMITAIAKPRQLLIECFEPVTGSHVGPGALSLFYLGSKR